jgi:hypothetical protein
VGFLSNLLGGGRRHPHPIHSEDVAMVLAEDRDWFGGLSDTDIAALGQQDNFHRYAAFLKAREEGLAADDAARRVWRYFPYYYLDPAERGRNPLGFTGPNAELPFLLKDRINRLVASGRLTKGLADSSETMNAAIRLLLQQQVALPRYVLCWNCKAQLAVTHETAGNKVRCEQCGTRQTLPR